uniref:H15 domain-containing protein n=1 Tax=Angiostrongylus cantonensis TaxID=6313 RepID=A0A0K0D691_ANGCA
MSSVAVGSLTMIPEASKPKEAKKASSHPAYSAMIRKAKASSHPAYSAMIRKAVSELEEKSGSSRAAILKFILSRYKLGVNITRINFHLRVLLNKAVVKGELKQVKGIGASGGFKLGKKKSMTASGGRRAHFVPYFSD